jgi:anti-sigma factor (TIGR02949 family)
MFRINLLGLDIYGCREALERLDDYLDRELSHEEQRKVGQHLKICHECARKFAFEHDLVNGLREKTQHVALPRDFAALSSRITQALRKEEPGPPES